ncbi:2-succinylbenzoate--CoA ligase [Rubrobacter xylanophilus DSM 9941]|uniref:o-succinylbenzoate--CoA ligase n=1 Tax=Rubrobacter xylanophilus TaxID=49319 RepID=UPI001C63F68C|nr:o-succinylbenzoate--CoA ligase [Rubrobacter xylanophilus]QYJ15927.1 2-succinylbenzoate--CoA ligase [Rubrobacter xylanophilus DSM 9941]
MREGRTVPCPLRERSRELPEVPAVEGDGVRITYRELDRLVSAAAQELEGRGLGDGCRVALRLRRGWRYVVLLLGVMRAGGVVCPVSTRLPLPGVRDALWRAGCRAVISDDARLLEGLEGVVRLRPEDLIAESGAAYAPAPLDIELDRPATVVFTSGSTGEPKAALHTCANHYLNAAGSNENITLAPGDRWMLSLPLYHVGGISILFKCLLSGATIALPEERAPLGREISRLGVTHASLVSTQLLRLLREDSAALGGLRAVLLGASAMPPSLISESVRRGIPVHTSYGLTEMASQVTSTPPGASREELSSSGRVLPHRELAVSGEGEILVRGGTLFAGYLKDGGVERPLDAEGWFHTRDLGHLDGRGYLHVSGRMDNRFVSGGENVQPEEIEEALCRMDGIEQALVVPVPDEEFGERPVAFVRGAGGPPAQELSRTLREVLPGFKVPDAFYPWPSGLPEGMKVDRGLFRRLARELRAGR